MTMLCPRRIGVIVACYVGEIVKFEAQKFRRYLLCPLVPSHEILLHMRNSNTTSEFLKFQFLAFGAELGSALSQTCSSVHPGSSWKRA